MGRIKPEEVFVSLSFDQQLDLIYVRQELTDGHPVS